MKNGILYFLILLPSFVSCSRLELPENATPTNRAPVLEPDYASITIPPNIAPMNFTVRETGTEFLTRLAGEKGPSTLVSGKTVVIPPRSWKNLLAENRGGEIRIDVFARDGDGWRQFDGIVNRVAEEPIDPWISYRLIEPGYEHFKYITINQRNLENDDERRIFENDTTTLKQCANCHSYQDRRTDNMLFHLRNHQPGTVVVQDGTASKVDLKVDQTISAGAYPAWHPTLKLVAFSVNDTFQIFHTQSRNRLEVLDTESDLVLYDVEKNEISHILETNDDFEIFPSFSQDGRWLYYCCAKLEMKSKPKTPERKAEITAKYHDLHYNVMRIPFDPQARRFGEPEVVVDAAAEGKSASHPRLSPCGRYLMYCLCNDGFFTIWHPESDLWVKDMETGLARPLTEVNSDDTESFHNWSSNGRWFIFSSRRDDGSYTRLYFSHFDEQGNCSKPFVLPWSDPTYSRALMKSYNVPEFMVEPVQVDWRTLNRLAVGEAEKATYKEPE